ncbi:MAG: type II secretion system F family protein [Thermoplasmata archaeon]|nr:MAG: type II secretion system F family protein [Thermoplasmata archaeon]
MAAETPSVDEMGKPVAPVKKLPEVDDDTLDLVKEFQDQMREGTVNVKNLVYIFTVLGIALCAAIAAMLAAGVISIGPATYIDFVVFAVLIAVGPVGMMITMEQSRIADIEKRLPDFLRDVAEAGRFGMTLSGAIVASSKGEYGRLTPEIRRMASQISWGVSATEALVLFAKRVDTPLVHRVTGLVIKASAAGGNIADVLTMSSVDTKESQTLFEERRTTMSTYVMVIYIAFFVFLVTVLILNTTFLPRMEEVTAESGLSDVDISDSPAATVSISAESIPKIRELYFYAALVHAVGDGILAGVITNGKIANGLKHSFVMVLAAWVVLRLVAGG